MSQVADTNWYSVTNVAGATSGFNADLSLICTEVNDAVVPTLVATYQAQAQTAINQLKAGGGDVVILASMPCSGFTLTAYTQALYDLADTNDLPLIDIQDRWGTYTLANGYGLMSDLVHPNSAGYADVARAVLQSLGL